MAANPRDVLLRPLVTEKTSALMQENKYAFVVALEASKIEIKQDLILKALNQTGGIGDVTKP